MPLLKRLNRKAIPILLRTEAYLLAFAVIPAAIYGFTHSPWVGFKVFLVFVVVLTPALVWAFWGSLFPKGPGGS
jgi:hypothetical protein